MAQFKNRAEYEKWKTGRATNSQTKVSDPVAIPQAAAVEAPVRVAEELPALKFDPQILGLIGAFITCFGVFLPFVKAPFVGSINYYHNGEGFGVFLLACGLLSGVLIFMKLIKWLYIPATFSAMPLIYSIYKIKYGLDSIAAPAVEKSNPFSGLAIELAEKMKDAIQIDYGAFVIFAGVSFQLISYLMYKRSTR